MVITPAINASNARELQLKAAASRKRNNELARQAEQLAREAQAKPEANLVNAYAERLVHAQNTLLEELLTADCAKDKAALSQALKNLRETYHMATGAPKPGTIKPESRRTRQQPTRPPEPEPIDPPKPQ